MIWNLKAYHRPGSLSEASGIADAVILGGGTRLLSRDDWETKAVLDTASLGLRYIRVSGTEVVIGAGTRLQDLIGTPLEEAARLVSPSRMIRNMATVAGEWSADDSPLAIALHALDARPAMEGAIVTDLLVPAFDGFAVRAVRVLPSAPPCALVAVCNRGGDLREASSGGPEETLEVLRRRARHAASVQNVIWKEMSCSCRPAPFSMKKSGGVAFTLNGRKRRFRISANTMLIDLLRSEGFTGVKRGCDTGECGSCAVLVDGRPVNSCIRLAAQVHGASVETIEGMGAPESLHPIQEAFVEHGAIQCGYCTPGMIVSARALLEKNPDPDESEVRDALAGNLCRCTGYVKPVRAVLEAAKKMKAEE